jgi:transcriptional regulator with GAF, ATPase, and Fis domain
VPDKPGFPDLPTEIVGTGEAREAGLRLVAMWNGGSLTRDLPARGKLTLGRGNDADVRIDHTSVSRRHAALVLGESMRVEDLGSSNGTWVAGNRLEPNASAPVAPGTLIELGTVLLLVQGAASSRPASPSSPPPAGVVVVDPQMQRVHELIDVVAKSAMSVILLGETGVGKEVLASRVHQQSSRAAKPFLKINCAALVESLLEAELFGYERGAFTGAVQSKAGLLEGAAGGTLFLDEVGELPLTTQAKLLRVLESGEVTRIGALKPKPIDVRFVSATNRDLKEFVAAGKFRQDLFFRLDGMSIHVPPLRERTAEISALAQAFVRDACASAGRPPIRVSEAAMVRLHQHPWPGNVRELKNVLARSVLLCRGEVIQEEDLRFEAMGAGPAAPPAALAVARTEPPPAAAPAPAPLGPGGRYAPDAIPDEERRRIIEALERAAGNQTRAAKLLGISRRTLLNRLDALGLPRPRKRDDEDE